jgi:hypothetical protein
MPAVSNSPMTARTRGPTPFGTQSFPPDRFRDLEGLSELCGQQPRSPAMCLTLRPRKSLHRPQQRRNLARLAIASAVYRPCLNAFMLPFGAPGDIPPCNRHRPFGIAGEPPIM